MPGVLSRIAQRLSTTTEDDEARELRSRAASAGGRRIDEVNERERVCVCGSVRSVSLRPRSDSVPAMVVDLDDGSRAMTLVWLGRRRITGIRPGVYLRARGLVTFVKGRPTIFNPAYELLPSQGRA